MRRRHDTLTDLFFRYRGVVLVVSVPILLILIVVTFMPRSGPVDLSSPDEEKDPIDHAIQSRVAGSGKDKGEGTKAENVKDKYAVIIDAGSTGSRIHVYKFNQKLELQEIGDDLELFVAIKPGLSAYKDAPKKAADSLHELIGKALDVVPEKLRPSTPIRVGATAGLRLLPGDLAEQILDEVRTMLFEYPFTTKKDSVKILDGADEGSFAWVTVNYLLGNLGKELGSTVGVVDLGGGSVQMTYAVPDAAAEKAPEGYVRTLNGLGKAYNVYVHSYLGYGLMAGRAEVLKATDGEPHACLVKGVDAVYKYGNNGFKAKASEAGGDHEACSGLVKKALKKDTCTFDVCSFGGIWSGGGGDGLKNIYVASYFFDRAGQFGVIDDPKAASAPVHPIDFKTAAKEVCGASVEEIPTKFPLVDKSDAPYACLDITYQYSLLTAGFGIDPETKVTLVKQVKYKGKDVEAAWPLGAAIDALA